MNRTVVIAHRGASAQAPENTLAAFRLALQLGVDMIELDVRFTADREVAVIHDATLRRTTGVRGKASEWSLANLRSLDAGSWFAPGFRGQGIPSLEDVCRAVGRSSVGLLIEIKADGGVPEDFADILVEKLELEGMVSRCTLQSFDHRLLVELRRRDPRMKVAPLFDSRMADPVPETLRMGAQALAVRGNLAGRRLVAEARRAGLPVFVWTVDSERSMKRMFALGVDGLITNRPQLALRLRAELGG